MNLATLFWIIFVFVLIFGGFGIYRSNPADRWIGGFWLAVWVELGLLGWRVFGPILQ